MNFTPYKYQVEGIDYLSARDFTLLSDDQGLGKTLQCIQFLVKTRSFPVLVVCPNTVKLNWAIEIEKFGDGTFEGTVIRSNTDWKEIDQEKGVYIINYEALHKHKDMLDSVAWGTLLVDEAHRLRNKYTRMGKQLFGEWDKTKRVWKLKKLIAKKKIFITGTPVAKCVYDLYPMLSYMDNVNFGYTTFTKYFYKDRFGGKHSSDAQIAVFGSKLRSSGLMLRRLKTDVLELPEKIYSDVVLDINDLKGKERDAVQAEIDLVAKIEDTDFDITNISSIRRMSGLVKVPFAVDMASDVIENSGSVVMGGVHRDVLSGVRDGLRKLGYTAEIIDGQCSDIEKQRIVTAFQNGEIQAVICNINSAGVGITLTRASDLIFIEREWNQIDNNQFEDRIHRIGQKHTCNYTSMYFRGTLDWWVIRSNQQKKKLEKIYNI